MPAPIRLPFPGENPLVSILISNYNYGDYLGEAVHSALRQDYPNVEVILCDDGSTDHSIELLQAFEQLGDPRLLVLKKENDGQATAVNAAFDRCRGDIICFLDSDDFFYPEKVSRIVQAFRKHDDAGFLIHRLDKVDNQNREFGQLPLTPELPAGWYGDHVITTGSAPHGFPVTSGLVIRREVACRIFPVNEHVVYDLDEIIRRLALLTTRVAGIDASLGAYRIHGNNLTSMNVIDRLKKLLPVYDVIWEETKNYMKTISPEDVHRFPELKNDIHHLLMNYVLKRTGHDHDKKISKELWKRIRKNESFNAWSPARRRFWVVAVHMPDFLFNKFVKIYWHSGGYKLYLSRAKNYFKN